MKNDPSPPASPTPHRQAPIRRSRKSRAMLLVLLVLLIASGIWAALLAYLAFHPAANPAALTHRAGVAATVTAAPSPTSHPTLPSATDTTTPLPGPTSTSQHTIARTPFPTSS